MYFQDEIWSNHSCVNNLSVWGGIWWHNPSRVCNFGAQYFVAIDHWSCWQADCATLFATRSMVLDLRSICLEVEDLNWAGYILLAALDDLAARGSCWVGRNPSFVGKFVSCIMSKDCFLCDRRVVSLVRCLPLSFHMYLHENIGGPICTAYMMIIQRWCVLYCILFCLFFWYKMLPFFCIALQNSTVCGSMWNCIVFFIILIIYITILIYIALCH